MSQSKCTPSRPVRPRRYGTAARRALPVVLALAVSAAAAACMPSAAGPSGPSDAPSRPVWVVSFGHSQSDQAEEVSHLADFEHLFLPRIEEEQATVIVYTVGLAGLGSPRVIGQESFATAGSDGGNPHKRSALRAQARERLLDTVRDGLATTDFSPGSDPFGGFAAAATFFAQYPASSPKTLLAFGDQVANLPAGCVLDNADLSAANRRALLHTCSPLLPNLRGVQVMLAGAGYSEDDFLDTALAQGLEGLYREFFATAGATIALYGPVAVNGGVR